MTIAEEAALARRCGDAYRNVKACQPAFLKGFGEQETVGRCAMVLGGGDGEIKSAVRCLIEASRDCAKIKACFAQPLWKTLLTEQ